MHRRINEKLTNYITAFKTDLKSFIESKDDFKYKVEFINYINGYERIEFKKEDFAKRKRVKNVVPFYDRCCAKKANDEQCTRRRFKEGKFCGTHNKSQPNGIIKITEENPKFKKVIVTAHDIKGIIYYLDDTNNVYDAADIVNNKRNPKVIAKYELDSGIYSIPSFGL